VDQQFFAGKNLPGIFIQDSCSQINTLTNKMCAAAVKLRGFPPNPSTQPATLALRLLRPSLHIFCAPHNAPQKWKEEEEENAPQLFRRPRTPTTSLFDSSSNHSSEAWIHITQQSSTQ